MPGQRAVVLHLNRALSACQRVLSMNQARSSGVHGGDVTAESIQCKMRRCECVAIEAR
jgi:hypothetical protein